MKNQWAWRAFVTFSSEYVKQQILSAHKDDNYRQTFFHNGLCTSIGEFTKTKIIEALKKTELFVVMIKPQKNKSVNE